jgi:hypothetical protein
MFLGRNVCLDLVKISAGPRVRSANLQDRRGGCTNLVRRFVLLRLMLPMMGRIVYNLKPSDFARLPLREWCTVFEDHEATSLASKHMAFKRFGFRICKESWHRFSRQPSKPPAPLLAALQACILSQLNGLWGKKQFYCKLGLYSTTLDDI